MVVGKVQRQNPRRLEMSEVQAHGLDGQQVRGDRIPGERIHEQQVIPLLGLALERQAGIPGDDSIAAAASVRKVNYVRASASTSGLIS